MVWYGREKAEKNKNKAAFRVCSHEIPANTRMHQICTNEQKEEARLK
jgi:hypothetical protein